MSLEVEITSVRGDVFTLRADPSQLVRDLKLKLHDARGIPVNVQCLLVGSSQRLDDRELLSSVPLENEKLCLTLIRRSSDQVFWLKQVETGIGRARLDQAPDAIRADHEVMLAAATHDPSCLDLAHEKLLGSSEFMLEAAKRNSDTLRWTSEDLLGDAEFVLAALRYSWKMGFRASKNLRSDRAFMLKAIMRNRWTLQCASNELSADPHFVSTAFMQRRREFILDQMKSNGKGLRRATNLRADRDVVRAAVNSQGTALEYAAPDLQADHSIVLAAVNNDPEALQWAAPRLRGDRHILTAALRKDGRAARWVPLDITLDESLTAMVKECKRAASADKGHVKRPVSSVAFRQAQVKEIPVLKSPRRPLSAKASFRSRTH